MNYFRATDFCFQAFLNMFFDNKVVTSQRNKTSWFCGIYCQTFASTLCWIQANLKPLVLARCKQSGDWQLTIYWHKFLTHTQKLHLCDRIPILSPYNSYCTCSAPNDLVSQLWLDFYYSFRVFIYIYIYSPYGAAAQRGPWPPHSWGF